MALAPEQRAAQRSLIGILNTGSGVRLNRTDGLCMWRGREAEEWGGGAGVVTEKLDVLGIPYTVAVTHMTFKSGRQPGFDVRIRWEDLGAVLRWMPSFQKSIDAYEANERERDAGVSDGAPA